MATGLRKDGESSFVIPHRNFRKIAHEKCYSFVVRPVYLPHVPADATLLKLALV